MVHDPLILTNPPILARNCKYVGATDDFTKQAKIQYSISATYMKKYDTSSDTKPAISWFDNVS